jgi:hypothetical protein
MSRNPFRGIPAGRSPRARPYKSRSRPIGTDPVSFLPGTAPGRLRLLQRFVPAGYGMNTGKDVIAKNPTPTLKRLLQIRDPPRLSG